MFLRIQVVTFASIVIRPPLLTSAALSTAVILPGPVVCIRLVSSLVYMAVQLERIATRQLACETDARNL